MYAVEHAPYTASAALIGYHIRALGPFWTGKKLSEITAKNCRAYARQRMKKVKEATARRELETLGAALRWCHKEKGLPLTLVTLPDKGNPRERWLTRDEVARLLWAARSHENHHLCRFILIGLYTGTRHAAILRLQWSANTTGGWVDLERGVLYRRGTAQKETRKRQPPVRLPDRLAAHMRRWKRLDMGIGHIVHWHGEPIRKERRAWERARIAAKLGEDVTPHTLRHSCATWLMHKAVPIWEAAGYLGMSEKMLSDVYGHHSPDFQKAAADAFRR